jgi:hypothetical protein
MKRILLIVFLMTLNLSIAGQVDSNWNVLLVKKGSKLELKFDMESLQKTGFYLYKNCIYEVDLTDNKHLSGRLIDVQLDTLFFTNFFNENVARSASSKLDTLAVYYKNLKKLNLISDRALGFYSKYSFDDFDFFFKKDTVNYFLESYWDTIFENDLNVYEVVPHLTDQGIGTLFEESGRVYYYYGSGMTKPDRTKMDHTYSKRNVFCFTPCNAEEINGLALGFHPKNVKNVDYNERDSLVIRGLSIEISPFAIMSLISPKINGPFADSITIYNEVIKKDWRVKILGVQLSAINTINEMRLYGLNVTGFITVVDELHGLSISGINNFSYLMNGLSIAGIRNRATFAKGVQIGLFNKASDMRGVQIGLWNTNGKRSLPLINWQFKPKLKK